MPIPIQVYQQAKKFEQEGYSPSEILQGLEQSKYADISTQIKQFREEGYSDALIYQGFNKSPVTPTSAIDLAKETLSTPLQNIKEFYSPMVDKVRDITIPESVKNVTNRIWKAPQEMAETGAGAITGALSYIPAKTAGSIVGAFDIEKGKEVEEAISNMFSYKPINEYARQNIEGIGQVLNYMLKPPQKAGEIVSSEIRKQMPVDISGASKNTADWLGYIAQFGLELAEFKVIGKAGKKVFTPKEKANIIIDKIQKGEAPPISTIKEISLSPEELKAKVEPQPVSEPLKPYHEPIPFEGQPVDTTITKALPEAQALEGKTEIPLKVAPAIPEEIYKQEGNILDFIRNHGGINYKQEYHKGELKRIASIKEAGYNLLNNKTGKKLDHLREAAAEDGLISKDSTVSDFIDLIERDLDIKKSGKQNFNITQAEKDYVSKQGLYVGDKGVFTGEAGINKVGTEFKINGENYKVTKETPEGKIILQDGETYIVDKEVGWMPKPDEGSIKRPREEAPFGAEYENLSLENRVELLKRQGRPDLANKLRQEEMFGIERNFPQGKLQGKGKQKEGFEMTEEMKARENEARQIKFPDRVKEPPISVDNIVKEGLIPITRKEAGVLWNLNVGEGRKAVVRLKTKLAGEQTGEEGWFIYDLPPKEAIKYGTNNLFDTIRNEKENRVSAYQKSISDTGLQADNLLKSEKGEVAIGLKFNPFQGLYKKTVKKFPKKIQEFLDPLSTLKDADSLLVKRAERGGKSTQIERIGITLEKWFDKYSPEEKAKMFDVMRGELPETAISPEALKTIKQTRPVLSLVGKMAVKEGLLPEQIYLKNKDTYIHYLYAKHILGEDVPIKVSGAGKLDLGEFKARIDKDVKQDLSAIIKKIEAGKNKGKFEIVSDGKKYEEIFTTEKDATNKLNAIKEKAISKLKEIEQYRKSIGLIQDPSKAVPVGVTKTLTDVYKEKYLKFIADNPDWTWQPSKIKVEGKQYNPVDLADEVKTAKAVSDYAKTPETIERYNTLKSALDEAMEQTKNVPKGFKVLPDIPEMGALRGLAVRNPIYDDLKPIIGLGVEDMGTIAKALVNVEKKSMAIFKMVKTGLNLPTATRNTGSNIIQLNMSGMNLAEISYYTKNALTDMLKRNPDYVKAERAGLFKTNWAVSEINELLEGMKDVKGFDMFGKLENMAKYYGKIDDLFKFTKYKYEISQGTSHQKAVLEALKWGMDYSRASRSVKYLRQHAIPFLSYPYKIAPLIAESLIERPWVIGKYAAIPYMAMEYTKMLNNLTDADQKRLEKELPYYIQKTGSYTVIPAESKDGKHRWTNLRYFFPWGDFSEKAKMLNQGEIGKVVSEDISSPTINVLTLMKNWGFGKTPKDPYSGQEIYSRFDKPQDKLAKTMAWLYNLHAPGMLSLDNPLSAKDFFSDYGAMGYAQRYATNEKDKYGRKITGGQAIGKFFGVNIIEPSKLQTRKIKDYQIRELSAGLSYALKKPNLSIEEKKRIRQEFLEQRNAIISGEIKEYIPVSKIKDSVKKWVLK